MIGIICAVSSNGVIGLNGSIPWHYSDDLKHFKKMTLDSTIIMGRHTFKSLGNKPLPNRKNIVVSGVLLDKTQKDVDFVFSIKEALDLADKEKNIWFIGGHSIYQEGMLYADEIHLTVVPDIIDNNVPVVKFPWINPIIFNLLHKLPLMGTDQNGFKMPTKLINCVYKRNIE